MRVLLDECVPKRLRTELTAHAVRNVAEMGWSGIKNGLLLQKAAAEFDCILTVDRSLQFQQRVDALPAEVREALASIVANELKVIGS
jgi:hypothetical protein